MHTCTVDRDLVNRVNVPPFDPEACEGKYKYGQQDQKGRIYAAEYGWALQSAVRADEVIDDVEDDEGEPVSDVREQWKTLLSNRFLACVSHVMDREGKSVQGVILVHPNSKQTLVMVQGARKVHLDPPVQQGDGPANIKDGIRLFCRKPHFGNTQYLKMQVHRGDDVAEGRLTLQGDLVGFPVLADSGMATNVNYYDGRVPQTHWLDMLLRYVKYAVRKNGAQWQTIVKALERHVKEIAYARHAANYVIALPGHVATVRHRYQGNHLQPPSAEFMTAIATAKQLAVVLTVGKHNPLIVEGAIRVDGVMAVGTARVNVLLRSWRDVLRAAETGDVVPRALSVRPLPSRRRSASRSRV